MSHVPRWAERGPSPEGAARAPTEAGEADPGTEAALKLHQLRLRHQECSEQIGRITIKPSPNKPISRPAGKLNAQLAALDRSNQARQNAKKHADQDEPAEGREVNGGVKSEAHKAEFPLSLALVALMALRRAASPDRNHRRHSGDVDSRVC